MYYSHEYVRNARKVNSKALHPCFQTISILTMFQKSMIFRFLGSFLPTMGEKSKITKHSQYGYRLIALDELIPNMYI